MNLRNSYRLANKAVPVACTPWIHGMISAAPSYEEFGAVLLMKKNVSTSNAHIKTLKQMSSALAFNFVIDGMVH